MTTHIITLVSTDSGSRARMFHHGHDIGVSKEPLFAAARYLIANRLADPRDTIETHRNDVCSMRSSVWTAAKLKVFESCGGKLVFSLYSDPPVAPRAIIGSNSSKSDLLAVN